MSYSKTIRQFLDDTRVMRSPQTYRNYSFFVKAFYSHVKKGDDEITVRDVIDFLKHGMQHKGWKISSMRQMANRALVVMQQIKDDQFIQQLKREISRLPRSRRYEALYEGNYIPGDRIDDFIDAARSEVYAVAFTMILKWGLRLDEMRSITLANINPKDLIVTVRGKGQGQEGKVRQVFVDRASVTRVMRYIGCTEDEIAGNSPVHRDRRTKVVVDKSERPIQYAWKRTARKIKLQNWRKLTPHDGRHSYAIDFLLRRKREGMAALTLLKNQLGHENINTTMIYLDIAGTEARDVFEAGQR